MLVEFFNGKARATIAVTKVEEIPGGKRLFKTTKPGVRLHFIQYSSFSQISEMDGTGFLEFDIPYDSFMNMAQQAAADPHNPLNLIRLTNNNN